MSTKSVLKTILLVWGIVSLCIVIIIGVLLGIMLLKQKQRSNTTYEPNYTEKSFGKYTLKTTINDTANPDIIHITLLQQGNALLNHYRLPIEKYGLNYGVRIDSVVVFNIENDKNGIMLISYYAECACESNDYYLWFLSQKDSIISIVGVINVSDLRETQNANLFWCYRHFYLDEAPNTHFSVPTEISLGSVIKIKPLLDQKGNKYIINSYEAESKHMLEILTKSGDSTALKKYKDKSESFQDIIKEKTIRF